MGFAVGVWRLCLILRTRLRRLDCLGHPRAGTRIDRSRRARFRRPRPARRTSGPLLGGQRLAGPLISFSAEELVLRTATALLLTLLAIPGAAQQPASAGATVYER